MKHIRAFLILFTFSTIIFPPAYAASINVTVKSGKKTAIHTYALFNTITCATGAVPTASFRQPAHGTLSSGRRTVRIPKGKRCAGKLVKSVVVYYRSNSGFRGRDKIKFGYSYPRYVGGASDQYFNVSGTVRVK